MKHPILNKRVLAIVLLSALVACVGLVSQGLAEAGSAPSGGAGLTAGINEMEGLPPLTAPGSSIALGWVVTGSGSVSETYVRWDTVSCQYSKTYRYRTDTQTSSSADTFYDYIDVPAGAEAIYLRPYAVIGGDEVWGPREYTVPTERKINLGTAAQVDDWAPERELAPGEHWYGYQGGTPHELGTADIYQSQRRGLSSFACWLSEYAFSMEIEVELHFAEFTATDSGQRVFNVYLEQGMDTEVAVEDIDVYAEVGQFSPYVVTRDVMVFDGQLDVTFSSDYGDEPILNGIVIRGIGGIGQRKEDLRVAFGADDTYVISTANHLGENTILLGGSDHCHGGLRFFHMPIPQGAIIRSANLGVVAAETTYQRLNLTIYADDVDDSEQFSSSPLVSERPRTDHSAAWQQPGSSGWIVNRQYWSSDLSPVIQEVIDRPGWEKFNDLSLLLMADEGASAPRQIWSVEGSYEDRAYLIVYFTPRESLLPTATPTTTMTPTPTATSTLTPTPTMTATATPYPYQVHLPLVLKGS